MKDFDAHVGGVLAWSARFISGTCGRWVDCEPSIRQRVYFANHSSHFDILIIWASLPREVRGFTRPLAARDYWDNSRLRRYLVRRVFNAIIIDRQGHGAGIRSAYESLETTLHEMGTQYSIILFPEGTRGDGENIGPFKAGLHHIALHKPGIELVPVYLENLNRILPKGGIFPIPLVSSISFGRPLVLREGEKKHDFLDRARNAVLALQEG
jgi:1-acyl-sn-glycerol-3-phosphate acyltransferase